MAKLKLIRLYQADKVPDHLFQEVCELVDKMGKVLSPVLDGRDANIILSAFNRFHAGMIVSLITKEGMKEAAQTEAIGLLKNIDHMNGTNHFGSDQ